MSRFRIEKDISKNAGIRRQLLWDGAHVNGAANDIREACSNDILFYINYFCFTFDPRRENSLIPFITYGFQDEAIAEIEDAINTGYDVCIGKSRDMGASWLNIVIPEHQWHFRKMRNFLMVSRNESYVDEIGNPKSLFWKIDFLHKNQPKWLLPSGISRKSMHIENTENGSVIDGESTTGEVARGDRRTAILLDEFAAFETKAGYNALTATQSATNCRVFNSTPKGSANAFHDVFRKSSARIVTMHWSQHPEKNKGLYTSVRNDKTGRLERKLLSDWNGEVDFFEKGSKTPRKVFFPDDYPFILDGKKRSPWYDRECSRAVNPIEISQELDIDFAGSDYQFFDPIAVERYKDTYCRDPEDTVDVVLNESDLILLRVESCPDGKLSLFEIPAAGRWDAERRFVIGVDISAGTGASNSTAAVYDAKTHEKVAEYADPNVRPDDFARIVIALSRWFNFALVVPDRSGPTGEVFVARLKSDAQDLTIFRQKDIAKRVTKVSDKEGVFLNPKTKTEVLIRYRDAIGKCDIVNRSAVAMDETLRFICRMDGSIEHSDAANANDPSGATANHGDRVIADALANVALSESCERDDPKDVSVPVGSLAWRMERTRIEDAARNRDALGSEWDV